METVIQGKGDKDRNMFDPNNTCEPGENGLLAENMVQNSESHIEKPFVCVVDGCNASFKLKCSLKSHMSVHETEESHVCPEPKCGKSFKRNASLKSHSQTHQNKILLCSYENCGIICRSLAALKHHISRVHEKKLLYQCNEPDCLKKFYSKQEFLSHQAAHHLNDRTVKCPVEGCTKSFAIALHLKRHLIRVHVGKTFEWPMKGCSSNTTNVQYKVRTTIISGSLYQCTESSCEMQFKTKGALKKHQRVHSTDKPFCCFTDGCKKTFKFSHSRTRHQKKVHNPNKEFRCTVKHCKMVFRAKESLKDHRLLDHIKERPFVCSVNACKMSFKRRDGLERHQTAHETTRPYVCCEDDCDKAFKDIWNLKNHTELVHGTTGRDFVCTVDGCGKNYKTKYNLKDHVAEAHTAVL